MRAPGYTAALAAVLVTAAVGPAVAEAPPLPSPQDVKAAFDARPELFSAVVLSKGSAPPTRSRRWRRGVWESLLMQPLGRRCVSLPISEPWTLDLDVRYHKKRTGHIVLLMGRLPTGYDGYQAVLSGASNNLQEYPVGCWLPKSGLSLLQLQSMWIAFPTHCGQIDAYSGSLPIVLRALHDALPTAFPKTLIQGHCGPVAPRLSSADGGTH